MKKNYSHEMIFDKNFKCENDIKKVLKINENKKTILYAPTFRNEKIMNAGNGINTGISQKKQKKYNNC
jgi:CDP-glycerol glycerophosphotransferase (TagB/SpsB family)